MLKELYIENLAVIEKATVSFCGKLNIFSGETGAGKSILIGGINAILGGRVSKDIVRAGENKAVVTALFDELSAQVRARLEENGYQCEDELLLQREISADGKSTARINGKTATATVLKEVAGDLIDIHGQHDNQMLMNIEKQREILDNYGGLQQQIDDYQESFRQFQRVSKTLKQVQNDLMQRESEVADLTEKIEEVEKYRFAKGEAAEVERKLEIARSYETVQKALQSAYTAISGSDDEIGATNLVRAAHDSLSIVSRLIPDGEQLAERLKSLSIELEDVKGEIAGNFSDEFNAEELAYLEERISDILRAERKYACTLDELLERLAGWKERLLTLQDGDEEAEKLLAEKHRLADLVKTKAVALSDARKKAASQLEAAITEQLVFLDMPNVRLLYDFQQDKIKLTGMDTVQMLISVNRGEEPKPINKIASGGELSRIMLAIKNVLAENDDIPTMIFDEIDTGISGRAAQKVGIKLAEIAEKRQVLCVTHLAQIAAQADNHLLIEKTSDESRTYTHIHSLDFEERKREIARIISGDSDSELTLQSAEELLLRKNKI